MTPDPYRGNSGGAGDTNNPQSWNHYAYVTSDPVNLTDPLGLEGCPPGQMVGSSGDCVVIPTDGPPITFPGGSGGTGSPSQQKGVHAGPAPCQAGTFRPYNGPCVPSAGYGAYVSCLVTGILGWEISNPEVPGVSVWAIVQGLVTGAAWGPGVALAGGVTITVNFFNVENTVAKSCAKATGYTPWVLQN
jgi:hypothetical protein